MEGILLFQYLKDIFINYCDENYHAHIQIELGKRLFAHYFVFCFLIRYAIHTLKDLTNINSLKCKSAPIKFLCCPEIGFFGRWTAEEQELVWRVHEL